MEQTRASLTRPLAALLAVASLLIGVGCAPDARRPDMDLVTYRAEQEQRLFARDTGVRDEAPTDDPYVVVLGIAQDAGYPQAACRRPCCERAWEDPSLRRHAVCLGIVDPVSGQRWMIDATPDFRAQLRRLDTVAPRPEPSVAQADLDGILLTHAHIGHYTGLVHLGREVIGATGMPVYAMPRLRDFLKDNGPWSLLVDAGYIDLRPLADGTPIDLSPRVRVTPVLVPHRSEFSETVGFVIEGSTRRVLYIPDIDKWEQWDRQLEDELRAVDVAYLDGTFFRNGEIPGRDMSEIPHPFIEQTLDRIASLPRAERAKVRFVHLNHTNPALEPEGSAVREIWAAGSDVAVEGEFVALGRD